MAAMSVLVIGDFADPLSFLASQRVEQVVSLGLHEVRWLAVQADRSWPVGGRPLDRARAEQAHSLSLPGETVPAMGDPVFNSRAATAAYAEAEADGVAEAMRRALFDAMWVAHRRVDDYEVVRSVVFDVLNPCPPVGPVELRPIEQRRVANLPVVPLGVGSWQSTSRRMGLTVAPGGAPLTTAGQRRIDAARRHWEQRGARALPVLVTELGECLCGPKALAWLARRLPHTAEPVTRPAPQAPVAHR